MIIEIDDSLKKKLENTVPVFKDGFAPTMKMTFEQLQKEQIEWVNHNFPHRTFDEPFMGVVEEVGELAHHLLKQRQGIRGSFDEHELGIKDSVGDITIFLSDFCQARGYNFQEIVEQTWAHVKKRDWKANPNYQP